MDEVIFDASMFRVMRYIYRREPSVAELRSKFENDLVISVIEGLCLNKTGFLRHPDGRFDTDYGAISDDDHVLLTPPGNKYVEDNKSRRLYFWVPYLITTAIAVASLIIAIIELVLRSQ